LQRDRERLIDKFDKIDNLQPRNLILSRMPSEQFRAISRFLTPVDLPARTSLVVPSAPVEFLYFPVSGMISVDTLTERGESVECAIIGSEGVTGVHGLLGHEQPAHSMVVQTSGSAYRARLAPIREEFLKGGPFAQLIHSFVSVQMVQMAQSVLCSQLHSVEQRMARWMLAASDTLQSDSLLLTQEYLAQVLGSRRSTVTVCAGGLQREGLVHYSRGRLRITNRTALEARACECYQIVRATYNTLYNPD
jgi:CRP-like cAMP-binding protein